MEEITEADYRALGAPDGSSPFTTERRWFKAGDLLGVVHFDNADADWSFVALARDAGALTAFDLGISHPTPEAAIAALDKALRQGQQTDRRAFTQQAWEEDFGNLLDGETRVSNETTP